MTVDWFALHHQSYVAEFFLVEDIEEVALLIWLLLLLLELKLTIHKAVHVTTGLQHILSLCLYYIVVVVVATHGSVLVWIQRY